MKDFDFTRLALAVSITAFMAAGSAFAAEVDGGDREFLEKAAASGQLEIETSKLAQQQAQHADVKAFAEMMITDHTAVDKELKALAASKGVELPAGLTKKTESALEDLRDEKGHDFDEEYADKIAVDAHQEAVDLFEDAAEDAKDAEIKAFAAKTLPSLQAHLEKGKALEKAVEDGGKNAGGMTHGRTAPAAKQ